MDQFPKLGVNNPEEILDSIARATENGFVAFDLEKRITLFSTKMIEVTGWHDSEMLGKDISALFQIKDLKSPANSSPESVSHHAATLFTRDGKQINIQARKTAIIDKAGKVVGSLMFFIIEDYNKDLDRAQAEFINTVSHELRTPITSIKGFAATLLNTKQEIDKDKRNKYIGIIKNQAERLARLVEDLLAVSRLESKKLQLTIHPVKIHGMVDYVAEVVSSKHNFSHEITIESNEDLPEVWVDKDRLEQVLTNLIDNAIKYSPESKKVDIQISCSLLNDKPMVKVDIIDYGIGIKDEDQQKIFTKFSRLDSPLTRITEGTGLGLYISKSLAKLLGGDLMLSSKEGATTFSLYLTTESHKGGEVWWD
ncbi:MAG: PAS domain-containing protein [Candidatus Melainabacteria bacterium]|nr:PAS domain-containing protein [Candidatus Melainabacteria bacterium]